MPRVIFVCPYIRPGFTAHKEYLVKYVATREGVDRLDSGQCDQPGTEKQWEFISQIIRDFPQTKKLWEYEDYVTAPTAENASDFISLALEQNLNRIAKRENYMDYIANRPHVQKCGTHGLFTSGKEPVALSRVAAEVANHTGNVWTPIISLRRGDAARLGYDSAESWQAFLSSYTPKIAEGLKIHPEHLRWYAAFHDEGHHPHVHMVCYSTDPKEGYLTPKGIEQIRSGLTNQLFRSELNLIYAEQSQRRDALTRQAAEAMRQIISRMECGILQNERVEMLTEDLARRLRFYSGKLQYGYLRPPLKALVDGIVDELEHDPRVSEGYRLWLEMRSEVVRSYKTELDASLPLSQQKEFKQIRNMVLREAARIMKQEYGADPLQSVAPPAEQPSPSTDASPETEASSAQVRADQPTPRESPPLFLSTTRMLHHMGNIFRENTVIPSGQRQGTMDKKQRQKLQEKRWALGHKPDDHEELQM